MQMFLEKWPVKKDSAGKDTIFMHFGYLTKIDTALI
jgi:hypothetical protein